MKYQKKKISKQIFDLNFHLDFPNPTGPKIEPPRLPLDRDGYVFFLGKTNAGREAGRWCNWIVSQLPAMTLSRIGRYKSRFRRSNWSNKESYPFERKPKPVAISMHAGFHPYRSTLARKGLQRNCEGNVYPAYRSMTACMQCKYMWNICMYRLDWKIPAPPLCSVSPQNTFDRKVIQIRQLLRNLPTFLFTK